ncbi:MAG TPA: GspMb/PilO family protein [Tepidisphaeraceae bacterium]|nr:GspMb/PilO family protein [Tepidisphaeraceae bacterium]
MVLSKREKYIAIGLSVAVGLWVVDSLAIEPYFEQADQVATDTQLAQQKLSDATTTFARQKKLAPVWAEIQSNGLLNDPSLADTQLEHALLEWTRGANVDLSSLKTERPLQQGMFDVISYNITANGSMRSISQFLWDLETASIPVRVTDMQVTPLQEGTDNLALRVTVSTVCQTQTAAKPAAVAPSETSDQS